MEKKFIIPKTKQISLWVILIFIIALILMVNIKAILNNCYNAADFAIYQQAIFDIYAKHELNPFISIRNIKILNDHFDPVIYIAVLFIAIFGQDFFQIALFEWLTYVGFIVSLFFATKKNQNIFFLPYAFSAVFSKLIISSYLYPIHPTTWAAIPLFWLTYHVIKDHRREVIIFSLILCFFKESYAFALFPMGLLYYFMKKDIKTAAWIICLSFSFMCFELFLKSYLLGPSIGYGHLIFAEMQASFWAFIVKIFMNLKYQDFLENFFPFLIIFGVYLRKNKFHPHLILVFSYFIPLLLLQIHANKINFQYGIQFGAILISTMLTLDIFHSFTAKQLALCLISFILTCSGKYTHMLKFLMFDDYSKNKCVVNLEKRIQSKVIKNIIQEIPADKRILSTGGIIPYIMFPNKQIDHYEGFSARNETYDYILLEVNRSGDTYPASPKSVLAARERCRPMAQEILLDNQYYFFAKGNFYHCVY